MSIGVPFGNSHAQTLTLYCGGLRSLFFCARRKGKLKQGMSLLPRFFTRMDAKQSRAIGVCVGLFVAVGLVLILGRDMLNIESVQGIFTEIQDSPFSLPITILVFTALAFFGAPQWLLMAGTIVAFGPYQGSFYSWIATMCSATFDFYIGKWVGAERLRRFGGGFINRFTGFVRKNGFMTSLAVRLVPTAPFIIVNMAAGVSGMRYIYFALGTGLGIIPKIGVVAIFGQGMKGVLEGRSWVYFVILAILGVLWIGIMLFARKRLRGAVHEETPP